MDADVAAVAVAVAAASGKNKDRGRIMRHVAVAILKSSRGGESESCLYTECKSSGGIRGTHSATPTV